MKLNDVLNLLNEVLKICENDICKKLIKLQEIKDLVTIFQIFIEAPSKLEIQCQEGMHLSFNFG